MTTEVKPTDNPLYDHLIWNSNHSWVDNALLAMVGLSLASGAALYFGLLAVPPYTWSDVAGAFTIGGALFLLFSAPTAAIMTVIMTSRAIQSGVYDLLALTNLTDRKIAEAHIRASTRRLRLLFVSMVILFAPLAIEGNSSPRDVFSFCSSLAAYGIVAAWGWAMIWYSIRTAVWAAHRWLKDNQSLVAVGLMAASYLTIVFLDFALGVVTDFSLLFCCCSLLLIISPFPLVNATIPADTVRLLKRVGYISEVPDLPLKDQKR